MILQAPSSSSSSSSSSSPSSSPAAVNKVGFRLDMGAPTDEIVLIRLGQKKGDPSVVTVNCPDQLGLGCDLARVLLEFGLSVVRGDLSTDGRWCFLIFWVMPRAGSCLPIKWAMLKKRLISTCPSSRAPPFLPLFPLSKSKEVYLLQVSSSDRVGLLNDMAQTLWEMELTIHKVKVTTSPEGKAIDLFYLTDTKDMLQSKKRQEEVCNQVRAVLGDSSSFCDLQVAGPEWGGLDCAPSSRLSPSVAEDLFREGLAEWESESGGMGGHGANVPKVSVTLDNSLSPGHTLLQISCKDRKGILYDCTRALKDFNIQVAYGRLSTAANGTGDIDLFILQADGKKVVDPQKKKTLCSRLEMEIVCPIRVTVANRGPDTELLVGSPTEIGGQGRPRVLYDVTAVLRMLDICIFNGDFERHMIGDSEWEVYRFLLADKPELALTSSSTQSRIIEQVKKVLIG